MWPSKGILKRFVRGGHVARCLWSSGYDGSGISCTENVFETQFFTTKPNFLQSFGVKRQMDVFGDFRAGRYGRAGRRLVGPVKIGGFQGPERLLISTRNRAQYRFLEALGVSVP